MEAITIKDLYKKFPGVEAIKGVCLKIKEGRCVGLLGPNGSGKSTLLKIITGLQRPTRGKVLIYGEPPSHRTRRFIALLPEEDALYRGMRVREIMDFSRDIYPEWREALSGELLGFLKIPEESRIGNLSRGFRARLKLLLAFSSGARVLLLDDPFMGIDPSSRKHIADTLYNYWRPGAQTLFISTHIIGEIEPLFDYVYFLREGEIILEGEADELRKRYKRSIDGIAREEL